MSESENILEATPRVASVWLRFDCGHEDAGVPRYAYGDGSAWCEACGEFQVYARCAECASLDCQCPSGPVLTVARYLPGYNLPAHHPLAGRGRLAMRRV